MLSSTDVLTTGRMSARLAKAIMGLGRLTRLDELGEIQVFRPSGGLSSRGRGEIGMATKGKSGGRSHTTYDDFMVQHEPEIPEGDDDPDGPRIPVDQLLDELKRHWVFRLLAAAVDENSPGAYGALLYFWLQQMGLSPPHGVFKAQRGRPGRPRELWTEKVYLTWLDLGRPPLSQINLATAVYGADAIRKASPDEQKKMVDRCRKAVRRRQEQLGQNPTE